MSIHDERDREREVEERPNSRFGDDRPSRRRVRDDTYDDEEPRGQNVDGRQRLIMLGASVFISFLVVFIWANSFLVSRSAYETDITGIVDTLGKLQETVAGIKDTSDAVNALNIKVGEMSDSLTKISSDVVNLPSSYAKADSIAEVNNNLATMQGSINDLKNKINNIQQPDMSDFNSSIDTLKSQITALDTRIKILEQGGGGSVTPSKAITVSVKTLGNNAFSPIDNRKLEGETWVSGSGGGYDGLQASMRVTLTNTTMVDVEDAMINLEFAMHPAMPAGYSPSLAGGGVPWHKEWSDLQFMEFYNGAWGLEVPAGQTVTLTLTLIIQGSQSDWNKTSLWDKPGGYYYQLQASAS